MTNLSKLRADGPHVRIAGDGYHVATVSPGMNGRDAYARLFAASADMVAALEKAEGFLAFEKSKQGRAIYTIVRDALSRAEGR